MEKTSDSWELGGFLFNLFIRSFMSIKLDQHREEREIETTAEIKQIIQSHLLPSLSQCVAYLDDVAN